MYRAGIGGCHSAVHKNLNLLGYHIVFIRIFPTHEKQ